MADPRSQYQYAFAGGAAHPVEAFRHELFTVTGGSEGIGSPTALKVLPLEPDGLGVRVLPGSALILSRYGSDDQQTYQNAFTQQQTLDITPTAATPPGGRSDLIVLRVEDPFAKDSPYPPPPIADRADAIYIHLRVIPGVPPGTTRLQDVPGYQNDSAITLSRLDIPAGPVNISAAMIKDLRELHTPKTARIFRPVDLLAEQKLGATAAYPVGAVFPGEFAGALGLTRIPDTAHRARIRMDWGNLQIPAGSTASGTFWVQIGEDSDPDKIVTEQGSFSPTRMTWLRAQEIAVPETMRGKLKRIYPKARLSASVASGMQPYANTASACVLDVEFIEIPQ